MIPSDSEDSSMLEGTLPEGIAKTVEDQQQEAMAEAGGYDPELDSDDLLVIYCRGRRRVSKCRCCHTRMIDETLRQIKRLRPSSPGFDDDLQDDEEREIPHVHWRRRLLERAQGELAAQDI